VKELPMKTARIARDPAKNLFIDVEILDTRASGWTRVREIGTGRVYWTPELIVA
jgi:hypothetical protein